MWHTQSNLSQQPPHDNTQLRSNSTFKHACALVRTNCVDNNASEHHPHTSYIHTHCGNSSRWSHELQAAAQQCHQVGLVPLSPLAPHALHLLQPLRVASASSLRRL
jgi:hypothetical protein